MGLIEKLFGKKNEIKEAKQVSINIEDYNLYNINDSEWKTITDYAKYISNILPLYVSNLNTSHQFHPDNLIRFSDIWFKTEAKNRTIDIEESRMIEFLGISLGMYVSDIYGMVWGNMADIKNKVNGNVSVVCGLIDNESQTLFFPISTFENEVYKTKGYIETEMRRIEKSVSSKNKKPDLDENFEEFINYAKSNGKSADAVRVWKKILSQPKWYFVTTYKENIQEQVPFVGIYDNNPSYLVFTSNEKALEFSRADKRFSDSEGNSAIISMTVENALKMIFKGESQGIFGLRFNENDININADINIPISILKKLTETK